MPSEIYLASTNDSRQWQFVELLRPIGRPGGYRSHCQTSQRQQRYIIVYAPTGVVAPCLLAIGLERNAVGCQFVVSGVKFIALDADGIGRFWFMVILDAEEVANIT